MTDFAMTQQDYDRLAEILDGFPSDDAMTLEELDGYLTALACTPEEVPPDRYLPELWGIADDDVELFPDIENLREFVSLVTRHFGAVMVRLAAEEGFVPLLQEDEAGAITGNDWAVGFLRGMNMDAECWHRLLEDEDWAGILVPILALAYEHAPDPEMRPFDKPVDEEQRELLLSGIGAAAPLLYEYFAPLREGTAEWEDEDQDRDGDGDGDEDELEASPYVAPYRRETPKVGRNEPCPCGSGKKYKRCCGAESA